MRRVDGRLETLPGGSLTTRWLDAIQPSLHKCADEHEGCPGWEQQGECSRNPLFMHSSCPKACGSCNIPIDEVVPDDSTRGDWKREDTVRSAEVEQAASFVKQAHALAREKGGWVARAPRGRAGVMRSDNDATNLPEPL